MLLCKSLLRVTSNISVKADLGVSLLPRKSDAAEQLKGRDKAIIS